MLILNEYKNYKAIAFERDYNKKILYTYLYLLLYFKN